MKPLGGGNSGRAGWGQRPGNEIFRISFDGSIVDEKVLRSSAAGPKPCSNICVNMRRRSHRRSKTDLGCLRLEQVATQKILPKTSKSQYWTETVQVESSDGSPVPISPISLCVTFVPQHGPLQYGRSVRDFRRRVDDEMLTDSVEAPASGVYPDKESHRGRCLHATTNLRP